MDLPSLETITINLCYTNNSSNEEKAWYGFNIARGKGLVMGEHWMYNKL